MQQLRRTWALDKVLACPYEECTPYLPAREVLANGRPRVSRKVPRDELWRCWPAGLTRRRDRALRFVVFDLEPRNEPRDTQRRSAEKVRGQVTRVAQTDRQRKLLEWHPLVGGGALMSHPVLVRPH